MENLKETMMKFKVGDEVKFIFPTDEKEDTWIGFRRGAHYQGVVTEAHEGGSWLYVEGPDKTKIHNDMYAVDWEGLDVDYLLSGDLLEAI